MDTGVHTPRSRTPKVPPFCKECGQPLLPKGVKKLPNEYDHASGCPVATK